MVQINFALKEVNCKIVYYGPGMSGKTTNLEIVHRKAPTANKGDLTSIATEGDRTLFFDFMPLDLGNIAGMRTKFQLYTVPGQVYYNSTRKLVLQGADGIIFVADSQTDKMDENLESLENLRNNLAEYGKDLEEIPMVLQFNKRDMPNAATVEELQRSMNADGRRPVYEAIASTGEGVFPTLKALSAMVLENLSREKSSAGAPPKRKPVAPRPAPAAPSAPAPVPAAAAASAAAPVSPPRPPAPPRPAPERKPAPEPQPAPRPAASVPAAPPELELPTPPAARPAAEQKPAPAKRISSPPPQVRRGGGFTTHGGDMAPDRPARTPEQAADSKPRPTAPKPPKIQKFVLEEDRGSPVLLIALGLIILVAAGVILYSFKIL